MVLTREEFRKLRPSRHPIVLGLWATFGIVSVLQLGRGVGPTSVNTNFPDVIQRALAALVVVGVLCNLIAPWIRKDKASLGLELGGVILCCTAFLMYTLVIVTNTPQWYLSAGAAWAFGMLAGTACRAVQIFRRGW